MLACIKKKKAFINGRFWSCVTHLAKNKANQVELKIKVFTKSSKIKMNTAWLMNSTSDSNYQQL